MEMIYRLTDVTVKDIQKDKYVLQMKFEWDQPGDIFQWTVDRIHNILGHINVIGIIESSSWR